MPLFIYSHKGLKIMVLRYLLMKSSKICKHSNQLFIHYIQISTHADRCQLRWKRPLVCYGLTLEPIETSIISRAISMNIDNYVNSTKIKMWSVK